MRRRINLRSLRRTLLLLSNISLYCIKMGYFFFVSIARVVWYKVKTWNLNVTFCSSNSLPANVVFSLFTLLFICQAQVFAGFSSHGNWIYNIIPLLNKKENLHLFSCPWDYNNFLDAYSQYSWEDVVLKITMSSIKSTDVAYKTHSG